MRLATFEDIVDNSSSVLADETPFFFVKVEGNYEWASDDSLLLKNNSAFKNDQGRAYFIVKPEYEVDVRVRSKNWKYFNLGDAVPVDIQSAYDIQTSNPTLSLTGWRSSISMTMRGGAMLAATPNGDKGKWDKQGSDFHLETEQRDITQPEDRTWAVGVLLSLTAPFGNYQDRGTYTLMFDSSDKDLQIDILGYRSVGIENAIVPTEGDVITNDPTGDGDGSYVSAEWSRTYLVGKGVDCQDQAWRVELKERQEDGMWFVITDGTIGEQTGDYDDALALARARVVSREAEAADCAQDDDPVGGEKYLMFGGIALVGVLVLIILARR